MTGAGSGGQGPPDGADAEEAERCPICLGVLAGGELAMPDSCCHVFCLRCLLTWAEVPVRKPATPPEAESCCCRNPKQKVCLKSKPARRLRRQKVERTADGKTKGLVRKCERNRMLYLVTVSLCLSDDVYSGHSVWVTEEMPYDTGFKHCKPQAQDCPWLSPVAPIPVHGTSRHNFHPSGWNHSPLPSPFTSSSPFGPGHFVFQGVVCAITCPKGGEKRGGRASTSKAPTKEAKSLPSRRSGRNSKSQEEAPASDPSSPPQSSASDSDSSTGQSAKPPGRPSQAPAKRKGKRVTNRKASGKRKAPARKKKSPQVVSSPTASEEDEEGDGCDNMEKEEEVEKTDQEKNNSKQQQSDAEGSLNEEQSGFHSADELEGAEPLSNDVGQDSDETREQSRERELKPDEGDEDLSCPSDSAPYSPGSCSVGDQGKREEEEEEEPASPVSSVGKDSPSASHSPSHSPFHSEKGASPSPSHSPSHSEKGASPSPSHSPSHSEKGASPSPSHSEKGASPSPSHSPSHSEKGASPSPSHSPSHSENVLLDNLMSPHCDDQAEQDDDDMEICAEEANKKESSNAVIAESREDSPQVASPSAAESEDNSAVSESKVSEDTDVKTFASERKPSVVDGPENANKEDSPSKDDTKVVPMDCSSPMSEQANSPSLEVPKESTASASAELSGSTSQGAKDESDRERQERERSQERKNSKQRRSRFHSSTSTWSPKKDSKLEPPRRSRSRERDGSPPSSRSSRARSREKDRDRDRDGERDYSRRERSRERRRRRSRSRSRSKSKSKSKSRSRSRSRSRTRSYRRGPSPERPASREQSPQRKERRGGWRSGQGSGSGVEGRRHQGGAGRSENGVPTESSPERQGWSENPDWVTEKSRSDAESKSRDIGPTSRWESRGRGGRGGSDRGRGAGRGGGSSSRGFYSQQEETSDNRWQPRNNFSGSGSNSGNDAYSRFNENRGGCRRKESDSGDNLDRSGWSSASSWAVRRTLPADVQDYYSKRERGGPGGWNRQEEEPPAAAADAAKSELPAQAVPGNAPVPVMNAAPPQLNVLQHHYPMQGPRGALPVSLQPAAPYAMPPQGPMHLHPAVPLLQVPAVGAQGLPPPPPPPPPMHQGGQTAAAQPDGYATQMGNTMMGYGKPGLLPTPIKGGVATATYGQSAHSHVVPSSTTQHGQHKAHSGGSKKEKKQQIQEKAVNEVKNAMKPYYQKKEITKDEYKEIVRKAVEKVCHSKSGEVNSSKVANLVKAYVDKYKHARKK
ncbi:Protein SCAF11 [Liparis tanakae]|uniref:Protein SCAF11 n=1 Tax=Liparis tanakae TaxID=230148 RepID=A0A4Z2GRH6_9TELE|nr:Protein SCAF11 [Liparis tanakae]